MSKPLAESLDSTVWLSLTFYHRSITIGVAPIPVVTPWDVTPSPRYYRQCGQHYRGFPTVTAVFPPSQLPCRLLIHSTVHR